MARTQSPRFELTDPMPFGFELIAPPEELGDLVNTFFKVTADAGELEEMMPAYSAQLIIYVEGNSDLRAEDGAIYQSEPVTCSAPLLNALPFTIYGPAQIVGASLTPLGWHCLSGLAADKVNNCTVPSDTVLSDAEIARLTELARHCREDPAQIKSLCGEMGGILKARSNTINADHAQFLKTVNTWLSSALNPPIEELYEKVAVSTRSAQRLCKRYYGVSPSRLVKRYRAIRAAMYLAHPDLSEAMRTEILGIYFDQAHLIRDIRRYTGRTPTGLKKNSLLQDTLTPEAHGKAAKLLR